MKRLLLVGLCIIVLSFQSCFQIIEDIEIFENGTGKIELKLNMSESKVKLNTIMAMDSINGYKVPSKYDVSTKLREVGNHISKIQGISQVSTNMDYNNFILSLKFNFNDISQVNKVIAVIVDKYKVKNFSAPHYTYNKDTKKLARTYATSSATLKDFNSLKSDDKKVFDNAKYISVYRLPNVITASNNSQSKLSANQKALKQDAKVLDVIHNKTSINQIITHK